MASKKMTREDGVRAASDRFYDALERMANGDPKPMSKVWSHGADVTTMHPIGGREVGWNEVKEPWRAVAEASENGTVSRTDQLIRVHGDIAYEVATEHVSMTFAGHPVDLELRVTNIYQLEGDDWKIVHHHTDTSEEFIGILQGMDAGA